MRAGGLKHRLELLRPVRAGGGYGGEHVSYEPAGTVWAELERQTGRLSEEAREHFPDYSTRFNVRTAHTVEENWRVRQLGGHLYTVTNILPNPDRGFKTLVCERVNE